MLWEKVKCVKGKAVKKDFIILIADRNPHVRKFLKREMLAAGYQVLLAENGREVLKMALHQECPDLLILDPNLPDADAASLITELQNRIPLLPIVVHTFLSEYPDPSETFAVDAVIEKNGSSIETLKSVVANILYRSHKKQLHAPNDLPYRPDSLDRADW